IALSAENGASLGRGVISGNAAHWGNRAPRAPEIQGSRKGDLEIHVFAMRGVFAAPFADELSLLITGHDGEPRPRARVNVDLVAGTPAESSVITDERGRAKLEVVPNAHAVEIQVSATWAGSSGSFFGALPVVPGALWLDPESRAAEQIRVVSPVPRVCAYATLDTRSVRLWGATIPLENDARGFASGSLAWPAISLSPDEPIWLTLSGDPEAGGAGTVGWPVAPISPSPAAERSFADELLVDGLPAAAARESHRRHRAVWLVVAALGAAAGLESILLWSTARARGAGNLGRAVLAVAAIVLAFAAIGIVAMWKAIG
ncbi:MAG TPA: hypothetical protein VGL13_11435, partial [Polyangiaceae bacterium]